MVDLFKFARENNVAVKIERDNDRYLITLYRNIHRQMEAITDDILEDEKHLEHVLDRALTALNRSEENHRQLINDWLKRIDSKR